jgi:hypothetical protein
MRERLLQRSALVAAVVATVIVGIWAFWPVHRTTVVPQHRPPAAQAIVGGSVFKPALCGTMVTHPFRPRTISARLIAHDANVLALSRDANNVPQAPPLSSVGKTEFAWDAPTLAPGSPRGNVLFNAHTWPDDSAMGNRLLDHLHIGGQIIVRGKNVELCYRVTKRFVIDAANGSPAYYARNGPPQLALIVCSPPRLGPGNWKNRTIWFAAPVNQATS